MNSDKIRRIASIRVLPVLSITTPEMTVKPDIDALHINLGLLLENQARRYADNPFLTLAETGKSFSYVEFNRLSNRVAHGLQALGMAKDSDVPDYLAIMLANGCEFLATSFALKKIAAIEVAINAEFRGPALARLIRLTRPRILLTASQYVNSLAEIEAELETIEILILIDDIAEAKQLFPHKTVISFDSLLSDDDSNFNPQASDSDDAVMLFSSGTTGVSKGCMMTHRNAIRAGESIVFAFDICEQDCVYSPYPLFHVGSAHYDVIPALLAGASIIMRGKFSLSRFWKDISAYGATWFMMLGSTQQLLWSTEPCEEETRHRMRFVWGTPMPIDAEAFEKRFKLTVALGGGYGSTDAGAVAIPLLDHAGGRVLYSHQVAIVDSEDQILPIGETGELVVRPLEPRNMPEGYFAMPEQTLASRQNLWFHTGDLARLDEQGYLYWVCRMSERIRVLGEMVSAYEVEEVLMTHPAIADVAVIGVPAEMGDDSVRGFVTLREAASAIEVEIIEYCRTRMSKYMVPREVIILAEMPTTPSGKPAKGELAKWQTARQR